MRRLFLSGISLPVTRLPVVIIVRTTFEYLFIPCFPLTASLLFSLLDAGKRPSPWGAKDSRHHFHDRRDSGDYEYRKERSQGGFRGSRKDHERDYEDDRTKGRDRCNSSSEGHDYSSSRDRRVSHPQDGNCLEVNFMKHQVLCWA